MVTTSSYGGFPTHDEVERERDEDAQAEVGKGQGCNRPWVKVEEEVDVTPTPPEPSAGPDPAAPAPVHHHGQLFDALASLYGPVGEAPVVRSGPVAGRGLHSSTSQHNLSRFCHCNPDVPQRSHQRVRQVSWKCGRVYAP